MKKLLKLSFLFALGGLMLTSCGDDGEEENPNPNNLVINVIDPAGGTTDVEQGGFVVYTVQMSGNKNMDYFTITSSLNGGEALLALDSTLENGTKSFTYNGLVDITANPGSTRTLNFSITDGDYTATTSLVINVVASAGGINTYDVVILGSQTSSSGSSYNALDDIVYGVTDATTNSSMVDFFYYDGSTNAATISAPDAADAQAFFVQNFATKNGTRFTSTSLTESDFNAIADDAEINNQAVSASDEEAKQLAVGDVVAFTLDGARGAKNGMFLVTEITGGNNEIHLTVKIQE